jgi:uncharacterized protein YbjT (DUF2867 family)
MILVTGATGNVGSEVVTALVERGRSARALVRDPARARSQLRQADGVDVAAGDLSDPDSVVPALAGVEGVFLLGGFDTLGDLLVRFGDAGVGHVTLLTSRCVVGGAPDNAITAIVAVALVTKVPAVIRAAALGWLVYSVPHFVYHARHLHVYDTSDKVLNLVALGGAVVLSAAVLVADWLTQRQRPR